MSIDLAQLTMNFGRGYDLCILKLYHRPHFTVGGCWNKSLELQPLQRCYCEYSGSPASACVMQRHYCITYTQSFHAINGLIAVGRVGNLLRGRPKYISVQTLAARKPQKADHYNERIKYAEFDEVSKSEVLFILLLIFTFHNI